LVLAVLQDGGKQELEEQEQGADNARPRDRLSPVKIRGRIKVSIALALAGITVLCCGGGHRVQAILLKDKSSRRDSTDRSWC